MILLLPPPGGREEIQVLYRRIVTRTKLIRYYRIKLQNGIAKFISCKITIIYVYFFRVGQRRRLKPCYST